MPARKTVPESVTKEIARFDQFTFIAAGFVEFGFALLGPRVAQDEQFAVFVIDKRVFNQMPECFVNRVAAAPCHIRPEMLRFIFSGRGDGFFKQGLI